MESGTNIMTTEYRAINSKYFDKTLTGAGKNKIPRYQFYINKAKADFELLKVHQRFTAANISRIESALEKLVTCPYPPSLSLEDKKEIYIEMTALTRALNNVTRRVSVLNVSSVKTKRDTTFSPSQSYKEQLIKGVFDLRTVSFRSLSYEEQLQVILKELIEGTSNPQISKKFGIDIKTVSHFVQIVQTNLKKRNIVLPSRRTNHQSISVDWDKLAGEAQQLLKNRNSK